MFLLQKSFTWLVRVTTKYLLFAAIVKSVVSLTSCSIHLLFAYRRPTDFCELILYQTNSVKVFITCRNSLVEILSLLMHDIISFANNSTLTSSFSTGIFLVSFNCLTALARISNTIRNWCGESGQPCLIPVFSRIALSFSPFNLILATSLL